MAIRIAPTTPGTVFISNRFIVILVVPIGMVFRETVDHMLAVNAAVQSLSDAAMTLHAGTWPGSRMTDIRN